MAVNYGYIYETTNLINGKRYIGQHKSTSFDPDYKGSGRLIRAAFNKYGWDNFSVRILCECFSKEELDSEEVFLIDYFNAVESDGYYNIAKGGNGGDVTGGNHRIHSMRTKEGMKLHGASEKISHSKSGKAISTDHARKLAEGNLSSWRTAQRKIRFHQKMKGNQNASHPHSAEHNAKLAEVQRIYQNTDEAKLKIAAGRFNSMVSEFIKLNLPYQTPQDWDDNCHLISYKRKYKSSYFLKFFKDWDDLIQINLLERS